jgi:two-component system, chemotaxis family, chemotaxis protein CheY
MTNVLLIDDEMILRQAIALTLRRSGHVVSEAEDGGAASDMLNERPFDVVVTDLHMPEADGTEVIRLAQSLSPRPAIIVISGRVADLQATDLLQLFGLGADAVLAKPFAKRELLDCIASLVAEREI